MPSFPPNGSTMKKVEFPPFHGSKSSASIEPYGGCRSILISVELSSRYLSLLWREAFKRKKKHGADGPGRRLKSTKSTRITLTANVALDCEVQSVAAALIELGAEPLNTPQLSTWSQIADAKFWNVADPMPLFASLGISPPGSPGNQNQPHQRPHLWPTPSIPDNRDRERFHRPGQLMRPFEPDCLCTGLTDMRPFNRLGVFIWDRRRMYCAGLEEISRKGQAPNVSWLIGCYHGNCPLILVLKRWFALVGGKMGREDRIRRSGEGMVLY